MGDYFKIQKFEESGKLYEFLGVKIFKRIILRIGKIFNMINKRFARYWLSERNKQALDEFRIKTMSYEKIHLTGTLIIMVLLLARTGKIGFENNLILITAFIINFYALILQRYNRTRIERVLNSRIKIK